MNMLDRESFIDVIRHTPLVSIDLLVRRNNNDVLLGHRCNNPARDTWFVPGGRIRKDETLASAFARICTTELGREYDLSTARFLGCFEHFYADNFADIPGISTHYVVLAYQLRIADELQRLPREQHDQYRWFNPADIPNDPAVHENTRAYFR